MGNGSVAFMNKEFNFLLDPETKLPVTFENSHHMASKSLVEEYMLLANVLVAKFTHKYCKDKTLLRMHADFDQSKKEKLTIYFRKIGLKNIDISSASTLSKCIERLKEDES